MPFPTVTVTPGSGQTINTLPNAGQATSANSLPVVVASDQSTLKVQSDNGIIAGRVNYSTGFMAPTIGTSGYTAGQCIAGLLGNSGALSTFFRFNGGSARLTGASLVWVGGQNTPITFFVFSNDPTGDSGTTITDGSTLALGAATLKKLAMAPFTITPAALGGSLTNYAGSISLSQSVVNANNTKKLWLALMVGATIGSGNGSTDMGIMLNGELD